MRHRGVKFAKHKYRVECCSNMSLNGQHYISTHFMARDCLNCGVLHSDHFGARYGDILSSFCQISHTFDQGEILLYRNILKYLHQKIYWQIAQLMVSMI